LDNFPKPSANLEVNRN